MGGSEKVQNYADVIYGLARMDAARLRMLEDTDDLRTMQKEKLVILFIKSRQSLFCFILFCIHSFITCFNSDYLQIVPENLLISVPWWELIE